MWLIIGLTMILLFNVFNKPQSQDSQKTYSEFWSSVESRDINRVTIQGEKILGTDQDGRPFTTVVPADAELIPMLRKHGVDISVKEPEPTPWYFTIFVSWFPMLLLIGVWIFFMRQMQMGGKGGALSFGKTRAKLRESGETKVTFKDVAGIDEAKAELEEIIDFLKDPHKFTKLGGRIPKGVLLAGSPGTGKTLLARAIAGEAEVPFFTISGSDFVEMFVGVGASRVRDLFNQGKKQSDAMKAVMQDMTLRPKGKQVNGIIDRFYKNPGKHASPFSGQDDEFAFIDATKEMLARKFNCSVVVEKEQESKNPKASMALPAKPAIILG